MASSDNSTTTSNGKFKHVQREILPIPTDPIDGFVAYDRQGPELEVPANPAIAAPAGAPTFLSCCLMTLASERPAYLEAPVTLPPPNDWLRMDCATRDSTRPRFVLRPAQQC